MHLAAVKRSSARRQQAFGIERRRDFAVDFLHRERSRTRASSLTMSSVISIAVHIAPDLMFADGAGLPYNSDPDLPACRTLIEDQILQHEP